MHNNYNEIINVIFYQTLEYIIAPMVLVVLMHFILGKKDKMKSLGDNTIEYNFISLYSNLLFYFSLSAHHAHANYCVCNEVESALLINCVFISFIVIVHKDLQTDTQFPRLLTKFFDWLWVLVLLLIFILIIHVNLHLHNFEIALNSYYLSETFTELFIFMIVPNHFMLLIFMVGVFYITIKAWKNQYQKSVLNYQKSSLVQDTGMPEISKEEKINSFLKIAENRQAKPEIRAQSYYYISELYFEKGDFTNAIKYIVESKTIALYKPYPEIQLLPIRKLKIKIHLELNEKDKAILEIKEVEIQLENVHENLKKTLRFCIDQLKNLLEQHA